MSFMGNAAKHADIVQGVNGQQASTAYENTQTGLAQQQAFVQALQGQNGIQNQSNVYNQLGQVAAGQGPNPAQAALAQQTQANIANQSAMAAGQRGASQNVGMIARQAGQQGANMQQQATGQAATMQAQQQMAAMNAQAGIAGQQVANQAGALNAFNQQAQGQQSNIIGALNGLNSSKVSDQNSVNQGAMAAQAGQMKLAGGAMGGAGAGMMSEGGEVGAPKSMFAQHMKMASGGQVPVMLSPGEAYIPPEKVQDVAAGASPKAVGKMVPGQAKVEGDSQKNDTVPAKLKAGGVVIPRTVMNAKDHDAAASKFVQAVMAKGSLKGKK